MFTPKSKDSLFGGTMALGNVPVHDCKTMEEINDGVAPLQYVFGADITPNGVKHFLIQEDEQYEKSEDDKVTLFIMSFPDMPSFDLGSAPRAKCGSPKDNYTEVQMFEINPAHNCGETLLYYPYALSTVEVEIKYSKSGETVAYRTSGALCQLDCPAPKTIESKEVPCLGQCVIVDTYTEGSHNYKAVYYPDDGNCIAHVFTTCREGYVPSKYFPKLPRLPIQYGDYFVIKTHAFKAAFWQGNLRSLAIHMHDMKDRGIDLDPNYYFHMPYLSHPEHAITNLVKEMMIACSEYEYQAKHGYNYMFPENEPTVEQYYVNGEEMKNCIAVLDFTRRP